MNASKDSIPLLAHERIRGQEIPNRWIFFVHGFLGKGQNWRSFARRLVDRKPDLGAILVDLRLHGDSKEILGPHSLKKAAQDLIALVQSFKEPVRGIVGHSFGAKVVLHYLQYKEQELRHAWLIDFTPWSILDKKSASTTYEILRIMDALKNKVFKSREAFIEELKAIGIPKKTAQWLSMNGIGDHHGFHLNINAQGLKSLLDDYFNMDLTPILEHAEQDFTNIHLILGELSAHLSLDDRQRLIELAKKNAPRMSAHLVLRAGHDVHMDNPEQLLEIIAQYA